MTAKWVLWLRFLAVGAAYAGALLLSRRVAPFRLDAPWFVCLAMVCFLGLAAMAGPVIPIRLPRALRTIRRCETRGGIYSALAVPAFGRLLRRTPLRLLNTDVYLANGARSWARLDAQLQSAEASHVYAALLVVPYMVRLGSLGEWVSLFWISLLQLAGNAYPVMHLRFTRYRLGRLRSRTEAGSRYGSSGISPA